MAVTKKFFINCSGSVLTVYMEDNGCIVLVDEDMPDGEGVYGVLSKEEWNEMKKFIDEEFSKIQEQCQKIQLN